MRFPLRWLVAVTAGVLFIRASVPATAQEAKPAPPAAAPDPAGVNKIIPEVNFTNAPLEDVINYLQAISPQFKAVIVREPGVPKSHPLVTMRLRQIPLGQMLDVLRITQQGINFTQVPGDSTVHIIIVGPPRQYEGREDNVVRVYRLEGAVKGLQGKAPKDALGHVLSLIKATLAQVDSDLPTLQIHEETMTLIFKGTSLQRAALEDVLTALDPGAERVNFDPAKKNKLDTADHQLLLDKTVADQRVGQLDLELHRATVQRDEYDRIARERATEIERLKVRLEMAQHPPAPTAGGK